MSTSAGIRSSSAGQKAPRVAGEGGPGRAGPPLRQAQNAERQAAAAYGEAQRAYSAAQNSQDAATRIAASQREGEAFAVLRAAQQATRDARAAQEARTGRSAAPRQTAGYKNATPKSATPKTPAAAYRAARRAYTQSRTPEAAMEAIRTRAQVEGQRLGKLQSQAMALATKLDGINRQFQTATSAKSRASLNRQYMSGQKRLSALNDRIAAANRRQMSYSAMIASGGSNALFRELRP